MSSVVFTWGNPAVLDSLYGMSVNETIIASCVGAWGTGQFAGAGRPRARESYSVTL